MTGPTRSKTELKSAEISRRDRAFQKESVNEQVERANKTARLRALRLAKEAGERELTKSLAVEKMAAKVNVPARKARLVKRRPAIGDNTLARPDADPAGS